LVPPATGKAVVNLLRAWTAVNRNNDGILPRRIEIGRLDHRAVQRDAVGGFELEQFEGRVSVSLQALQYRLVVFESRQLARLRAPQLDLARRVCVRPGVDVVLAVGRHVERVIAAGLRQLALVLAVEADRI
jgi:hypothetical protein